ncbi:MAG: phenylalanine--tRNA ligase subunit beta, partial [Planctomycetes bacterium]|nr:phenylalanine--tRNA ligase subunit beta [Planctomycetota bacterium]
AAPSYEPADLPGYHPGRAARVLLGGKPVGTAGELLEATAARYDLRRAPAALEIDFAAWVAALGPEPIYREFSRYPEVQRDLAFVLDDGVTWRELESCARAAAPGDLLEGLRFFDLYRGKGVAEGKKSLAFSLTFRAADRTLTGAEVDAAVQGVVAAVTQRFAATLRA